MLLEPMVKIVQKDSGLEVDVKIVHTDVLNVLIPKNVKNVTQDSNQIKKDIVTLKEMETTTTTTTTTTT